MSDEKNKNMRTILLSLIIGFLGGVGTIHVTIASDVKGNAVSINELRSRVAEYKLDAVDHWKESNKLITTSIEATTKLVSRIDVQNQLLQDQANAINKLRTRSNP